MQVSWIFPKNPLSGYCPVFGSGGLFDWDWRATRVARLPLALWEREFTVRHAVSLLIRSSQRG